MKKDAPYQKIEDLKGKNLCLVDPNSTSGNNVPRFAMNKMGIDPDKFFGKVVYAGSHENAVIARAAGHLRCGVQLVERRGASRNLLRMDRKGMVKADDFRMIFKSEQIVNSPMAYLTDLPADLKAGDPEAVLERRAPRTRRLSTRSTRASRVRSTRSTTRPTSRSSS